MTVKLRQAKKLAKKYDLKWINPSLSELQKEIYNWLIFEEIPVKYFASHAGQYMKNHRVAGIWESKTSVLIAFFKER